MRLALSFLAFVSLSSVGCDCGGTPIRACRSDDDCMAGQRCLDRACVPAADTSFDGGRGIDVPGSDVPAMDTSFDANCIVTSCLAAEGCGDGLDEDCDGMVDEDCACVPGSTARCLPGRLTPDLPRCSWGEMSCEGAGEFGMWGPCAGGGGDVDGGMSLYGCRRIGIMGAPGANPSSNFQAWLETQGAIATRFQASAGAGTLRREELDTFDLVIVDWLQRTYTTEESMTLTQWVLDGGGLFVMTGHDSGATADRHVSLLATLGPNYDLASGAIDGPAILLPHPSTSDGAGGTLPPVTFYGGLRVVVPAALMADVVPMAVIGSEVVGVAGPLGAGQILLFGDEWIEFDSEWATMPPIPRFWENAVRWLAPDEPVLPACE